MMFFSKLVTYIPSLLKGLGITLELTLLSAIIGFFAAIFLVVGVLYGNRFFKILCNFIITIIRGTPMMVQLFLIYFGLPGINIKLSPLTAAVIAFIINSSAYQAEYLKGGFMAISKEQIEAAYSIGLNKWDAIRLIVFPQAFRFAIPALSNEIVYLIQYTSVAYTIGLPELFYISKNFASKTYMNLEIYLFIGIIYLIFIYIITKLTDIVEKKLYIPGFDTSHLK
ncbi:MAG: amino acid ABC transporter permease [Spirochaetales bacterium]|jgi:polar amino acid transport system permease protein|nr:amino acid ABC transporter permease [Exilispira sp.]NMC66972.1 amino acid ABC transporter permease [Spirochaetales bacterium]